MTRRTSPDLMSFPRPCFLRVLAVTGSQSEEFAVMSTQLKLSVKRSLLLTAAVLFSCAGSASAQSYFEFLGPAYSDQVKYSPKYGIPYRDQGFDQPLSRGLKKAKRRGAPEWVLEEIGIFPGSPDAIGQWIDEAFDEARASFQKCGGRLADFASSLTPASLSGGVSIEPTIWYEPALKATLAGAYYPDVRSIRVVNIYYGTSGDYRHARLLLVWEMKNHFGTLAGIQSEPLAP